MNTDAYGDEQQLWALRQALEDNVPVPCAATIASEPVKVTNLPHCAGQMGLIAAVDDVRNTARLVPVKGRHRRRARRASVKPQS